VTTMMVLFNLKTATNKQAYEDWARGRDIPAVRSLPSVSAFNVHRTSDFSNPSEQTPYSYVEVIEITEMESFKNDIAQPAMQEVAKEFQRYADRPIFAVLEPI